MPTGTCRKHAYKPLNPMDEDLVCPYCQYDKVKALSNRIAELEKKVFNLEVRPRTHGPPPPMTF